MRNNAETAPTGGCFLAKLHKVVAVDYFCFLEGERVVGIGTTMLGSNAIYIIKTISGQDDTDLYGDNTPFETQADAILDFSEKNPFGEF